MSLTSTPVKIDLKILKSFTPYLGTVILILGYIKIDIYYSFFQIDIIAYLSLQELLKVFLPDILLFVALLLIGLFITILKPKLGNYNKRWDKINRKILKVREGRNRVLLYFKKWSFFLVISILSSVKYIVLMIAFVLSNIEIFWSDWLPGAMPFLVTMVFILFEEVRYRYYLATKSTFNPTVLGIVLALFFMIVFSLLFDSTQIMKTMENHELRTSFVYAGELVETDEVQVYVGQTENYLFLYNKELKEASIFKRESIDFLKVTAVGDEGPSEDNLEPNTIDTIVNDDSAESEIVEEDSLVSP